MQLTALCWPYPGSHNQCGIMPCTSTGTAVDWRPKDLRDKDVPVFLRTWPGMGFVQVPGLLSLARASSILRSLNVKWRLDIGSEVKVGWLLPRQDSWSEPQLLSSQPRSRPPRPPRGSYSADSPTSSFGLSDLPHPTSVPRR